MRILFSGGGTQGHILPNLTLIDEGKSHHDILYVGSESGPEKSVMEHYGVTFRGIACGKLRRYFSWKNFGDMMKVPVGFFQAVSIVKKFRPDVIFVTGGYVSVPAALAGFWKNIPVVLHESDVSPGLANRICSRFAKVVCLTFDESRRFFPSKKIAVTGNPIRKKILHGTKEKGLKFLGFSGTKPIVLVMGGSLGAQTINELLSESLVKLLPQCDVIHITGPTKNFQCPTSNLQRISNFQISNSQKENLLEMRALEIRGWFLEFTNYRSFEYLDDELPDVYAASDLVVGRSGAGMITELLAIEKPMILLPLPKTASRGEQLENAALMESIGAATILRGKVTPKQFTNIILDHIHAPERLQRMKNSMHSYGQKMRMAARKIIDILTQYDHRH